jgi:hypothetical protein
MTSERANMRLKMEDEICECEYGIKDGGWKMEAKPLHSKTVQK